MALRSHYMICESCMSSSFHFIHSLLGYGELGTIGICNWCAICVGRGFSKDFIFAYLCHSFHVHFYDNLSCSYPNFICLGHKISKGLVCLIFLFNNVLFGYCFPGKWYYILECTELWFLASDEKYLSNVDNFWYILIPISLICFCLVKHTWRFKRWKYSWIKRCCMDSV